MKIANSVTLHHSIATSELDENSPRDRKTTFPLRLFLNEIACMCVCWGGGGGSMRHKSDQWATYAPAPVPASLEIDLGKRTFARLQN